MSINRNSFREKLKEALEVDELDDKVDLLIYLDYVLFMEKLARVTEKEKKKTTKRNKTVIIRNDDVYEHAETVLNQFRG